MLYVRITYLTTLPGWAASIICQPYEILTVAVTNLAFFPKEVNISCPKQTIEQSQFSCHKIPHYTCYVLKKSLCRKSDQTIFCTKRFLLTLCPRRTCHNRHNPLSYTTAPGHTRSVELSPVNGKGLFSSVPFRWCIIVFWAEQFPYQFCKVWIDIS